MSQVQDVVKCIASIAGEFTSEDLGKTLPNIKIKYIRKLLNAMVKNRQIKCVNDDGILPKYIAMHSKLVINDDQASQRDVIEVLADIRQYEQGALLSVLNIQGLNKQDSIFVIKRLEKEGYLAKTAKIDAFGNTIYRRQGLGKDSCFDRIAALARRSPTAFTAAEIGAGMSTATACSALILLQKIGAVRVIGKINKKINVYVHRLFIGNTGEAMDAAIKRYQLGLDEGDKTDAKKLPPKKLPPYVRVYKMEDFSGRRTDKLPQLKRYYVSGSTLNSAN